MTTQSAPPDMVLGKVPVDLIDVPADHVREANQKEDAELRASIQLYGLMHPITVRQADGRYQLVAGARRLREVRALGWAEVPASVREADDITRVVLRTIENVQRYQYHPLEEAREYATLRDAHKLSQQEIAKRIGRSPLHVSQRLALLRLPEQYQKLVQDGTPLALTLGDAVELARLAEHPTDLDNAYQNISSGADAAGSVRAQLAEIERRERHGAANEALGDKSFLGVVGVDGWPYDPEPAPGVVYWPAGRAVPADTLWEVAWDGKSQRAICANPLQHVGDEDPQVARSAQDIVERSQAGTAARPAQSITPDEVARERARADAKHWRELRKRDELREAFLTKVARKAVRLGDVQDLIFQGLIESLPTGTRDIVYARANVPKRDREEGEGFGDTWDLETYYAGRGSLLKLAYAAALQLLEDGWDDAVRHKEKLLGGQAADRAVRYFEHLQGAGYAVSPVEAEMAGFESDNEENPHPGDDPEGEGEDGAA